MSIGELVSKNGDLEVVVEDAAETIQTEVDIMMNKMCDICAQNPWKYKCPGCRSRTCSLVCCKEHKISLGCDGTKGPAGYIPMSDFDTSVLLSDYRFLEDATRVSENSRRLEKSILEQKDTTTDQQGKSSRKYEKALKNFRSRAALKKACRDAKIFLEFQPAGLEKSSYNQSSCSSFADNTIFWTVEVVFVSFHGRISIRVHRIPDSLSLATLFRQFLLKKSSKRQLLEITPEQLDSLSEFCSTCEDPEKNIFGYMKIERYSARGQSRYVKLEFEKSLKENLKGLIVVEFPVFYVVSPYRLSLQQIFPTLEREEAASHQRSRYTEGGKSYGNQNFSGPRAKRRRKNFHNRKLKKTESGEKRSTNTEGTSPQPATVVTEDRSSLQEKSSTSPNLSQQFHRGSGRGRRGRGRRNWFRGLPADGRNWSRENAAFRGGNRGPFAQSMSRNSSSFRGFRRGRRPLLANPGQALEENLCDSRFVEAQANYCEDSGKLQDSETKDETARENSEEGKEKKTPTASESSAKKNYLDILGYDLSDSELLSDSD